MLDRLRKRVLLAGTLQAVTALHVGSGRSVTTVGTDAPVMRDGLNRPFIPGSSFKGVLRSSLEALLRGRVGDQGLWACERMDSEDRACVTREDRHGVFGNDRLTATEKADRWVRVVQESSCSICALFGSPWLAGRVRVADLPVVGEWQQTYYSIRDGVAIARDTLTVAGRLKYDFEAVPAGTKFKLALAVDNPEDWEMGLIGTGFEMFNEGYAAIGGKTSRGLGRVHITVDLVEEKTAHSFLGTSETTAVPLEVGPQTSEETLTEPYLTLVACVGEKGAAAHDEVVGMLQARGWTKEALRDKHVYNYRQLFARAVAQGTLMESEGRLSLPGPKFREVTTVEGVTVAVRLQRYKAALAAKGGTPRVQEDVQPSEA